MDATWAKIGAVFVGVAFIGWLLWGIVAALVPIGLFIALVLSSVISQAHEKNLRATLEKEGQLVKAYIVFANEGLYRVNQPENMYPAQVVFTPNDRIPDLDQFLAELAEEVRGFRTEEPETDDERIISEINRIHIGYHTPLLIPKRITGGIEAYTATIDVGCEKLDGGKLRENHIYCRVKVNPEERKGRVARMTNYPLGSQKKRKPKLGPLTWEEKEHLEGK